MKKGIFLSILFTLSGCSAHSPFIIKNTVDSKTLSAQKYPAHANKIFITRADLPPSVKLEILESIEVGRIWYGSSGAVEESMANRAREIGADAVIDVKTWHQPSGFSWAAPHGSGQAVKILEPNIKDVPLPDGEWF